MAADKRRSALIGVDLWLNPRPKTTPETFSRWETYYTQAITTKWSSFHRGITLAAAGKPVPVATGPHIQSARRFAHAGPI